MVGCQSDDTAPTNNPDSGPVQFENVKQDMLFLRATMLLKQMSSGMSLKKWLMPHIRKILMH